MASVAPVNRVTNSRTQRLVWRVGDVLLAPYRKLRPPPEESVVYQLAYATCFTLGVMTPLLPNGASEAGWWGAMTLWADMSGGSLSLRPRPGLVEVVDAPRPTGGRYEQTVQVVDGAPAVVWVPRPTTADEAAIAAAAVAHESNRAAVRAIITDLRSEKDRAQAVIDDPAATRREKDLGRAVKRLCGRRHRLGALRAGARVIPRLVAPDVSPVALCVVAGWAAAGVLIAAAPLLGLRSTPVLQVTEAAAQVGTGLALVAGGALVLLASTPTPTLSRRWRLETPGILLLLVAWASYGLLALPDAPPVALVMVGHVAACLCRLWRLRREEMTQRSRVGRL